MKIVVPIETDFEKINLIAKQVHDLHVDWRPDFFVEVEQPIPKDYLKELIESKSIYIAKENSNIMGYVIISRKENKAHGLYDRKIILIEALGVEKSYQRKSVGKQLMHHIINLGREEQYTDIQLTVNEENIKAINFYEGIGMRVKNISYSMKI